jgi:hypothetical protein
MLKLLFYIAIGIIILTVLIGTPLVIKLRKQGEVLYDKYDTYTRELLNQRFSLKPHPVKAEFQTLHSWRLLKLFKIVMNSQQGERIGRVNSQDATMLLFMKMYTLVIRPEPTYNLPMLSVDIIFIGKKRVFIIEVIDPAHIDDQNKAFYYEQMKKWLPEVAKFEQSDTREWYKDYVTDFSIHVKTDHTQDELLFEIYKSYLNAYLEMAQNAEKLSPEMSAKIKAGLEKYVSTLLDQGGPAVDFLEKMMGPEGQREYIRTAMFGLD